MNDAVTVAWVHVGFETLSLGGALVSALCAVVILLARKTFVSREELDQRVNDHAKVHDVLTARLAESDTRFVSLTAGIESVKTSADQAKGAADDASAAAEKLAGVYVSIAELRGDMKSLESSLKPIERLTMDIVEGYMAVGRRKGA